jgi:uncharacterized protein YabE (DUF348 family)
MTSAGAHLGGLGNMDCTSIIFKELAVNGGKIKVLNECNKGKFTKTTQVYTERGKPIGKEVIRKKEKKRGKGWPN